ncbi:hypothetical protein HAX54_050121, partial [Datura stramonium]|nr:hypothetical protein [Datura stramonium]
LPNPPLLDLGVSSSSSMIYVPSQLKKRVARVVNHGRFPDTGLGIRGINGSGGSSIGFLREVNIQRSGK